MKLQSLNEISRNKGVGQRAGRKLWERERNCANGLIMEKLSDHLVDGFKGGQGIVRERETLVIERKVLLSQVTDPSGKLNQLCVRKCTENKEIFR